MVGINPADGRIPLRFSPGPSMGLEPLIKVWGLLQNTKIPKAPWKKQHVTNKSHQSIRDDLFSYQTELTTLIKFSPAALAMTCDELVPVVMDVTMVGRGMVMTGRGWLKANCCWGKGVSSGGCDWLWTMAGSEGVGVTERGIERESVGCGVEHGVLVGVGVEGLGVPDPKKWRVGQNKLRASLEL